MTVAPTASRVPWTKTAAVTGSSAVSSAVSVSQLGAALGNGREIH